MTANPHIALSRHRATLLAAACAVLAAALLALASPAAADADFCPPGTGAGQCEEARGIATDFETERAYVADEGNNRINVFKAEVDGSEWKFLFAFGWGVDTGAETLQTCTTASGCQPGLAGDGAGQFSSPRSIAVDNTPGSVNRHDLYVTDGDRVNHFEADGSFVNAFGWGVLNGASELQNCTTGTGCVAAIALPGSQYAGTCQLSGGLPVSVGPGGNVFVAVTSGRDDAGGPFTKFTAKIEKFSPAGACLGETVLWTESNKWATSLAIDEAGDAYVANTSSSSSTAAALRKYDLATPETVLCGFDEPTRFVGAMTLDADGRLFGNHQEPGAKPGAFYRPYAEFDDACNVVQRFGYGETERPIFGIAALHTGGGDLLASEEASGVKYLSIGSGPIVIPQSLRLVATGATKATIGAEVNAEGKATEVRIQYVDEQSYQEDIGNGGDGYEGAGVVEGPPTNLTPSFSLQYVEAQAGCKAVAEGGCLREGETYRYRVIAENADGESSAEGEPFEPTPHFLASWAQEVDTDSATLAIEANPYGVQTDGYLEYVEEQSFGESGFATATRVPAGIGSLDFGTSESPQIRRVPVQGLTPGTEYRYRAVVEDDLQSATGPVQVFRTFATQTAAAACSNDAFRTGAGALLPDCRAYELVSPLDKGNGDVVVLPQANSGQPAAVNQSALAGERFTYGSYRSFGDAKSAPYTSQYLAARSPEGWQSHGISPPQGEPIVAPNLDFEFRAFDEDLCRGWINPAAEPPLAPGGGTGFRGLYQRTDELCGGNPDYLALIDTEPERLKGPLFDLEVQGISADGSITAFAASDTLTGTGAPAQPGSCSPSNSGDCRSWLYVKGPESPPVFACVLPGGASSTGSCGAGSGPMGLSFGSGRTSNVTNALSDDGSRLYWLGGPGDDGGPAPAGPLYLRENPLAGGTECSGPESPCTYPVSASSTTRFWSAAADGSAAIYTTELTNNATVGELYRYDAEAKASDQIAGEVLGFLGASDDASRVYFASREAIVGSGENSEGAEAQAGEPNLYLYGAGEDSYRFVATLASADVNGTPLRGTSATAFDRFAHNGRVNDSGLQAAFMSEAPLTGYDNTDAISGKADNEVFLYDAAADGGAGELVCASCNPSGSRPRGASPDAKIPFWVAARLPSPQTSLYDSNLLSPDGTRLLFEAQDSLVPRDTNGRIDVYQWERAGEGGCATDLPTYSPEAGGCIDLISSGQSVRDSNLLDASGTGDDIFFTTLSSLWGPDYGLVDVYDARVGGGYPEPPPPPAGCEGEACQGPYVPPSDLTPASALFHGAGNVKPTKAKKCPKGKVKKKGRCVKKGKSKKHRSKSKNSARDRDHRKQRSIR